MRKRSVDAYKVLEQLRNGMTASAIAEEQGVTRQAINVWRQKFIEQGILEKPKLGRPQRDIQGIGSIKVEGLISRQFEKLSVPLHQRISELKAKNEELQGRIRSLEKERELEEENYRKDNIIAALTNELNIYREQCKHFQDMTSKLRPESEHQDSPT